MISAIRFLEGYGRTRAKYKKNIYIYIYYDWGVSVGRTKSKLYTLVQNQQNLSQVEEKQVPPAEVENNLEGE